MLFPDYEPCTYEHNQLLEVICQLRFPTILSINESMPAAFQEEVREEFPQFSVRAERMPVPAGQQPPAQPLTVNNYQFISGDGKWKLNMTQSFIAMSTVGYTDWRTFAGKLDKPLGRFIQRYRPAYFERVGLRYMNAVSRMNLGLEDTPWNDLIQPAWLGVLDEEDLPEQSVIQSATEAELWLPGKVRLKAHTGPGRVKRQGKDDPEVKFILDFDLSMSGKIDARQAAPTLDILHDNANRAFQGAITIKLHEAMEPV